MTHRLRKVRRIRAVSCAWCEWRQVRRRCHARRIRHGGAADAIIEAVEQPLRLHILPAWHARRQQRGAVDHLMRDGGIVDSMRAALAVPRHNSAACAGQECKRVARRLAAQKEDAASEQVPRSVCVCCGVLLQRGVKLRRIVCARAVRVITRNSTNGEHACGIIVQHAVGNAASSERASSEANAEKSHRSSVGG